MSKKNTMRMLQASSLLALEVSTSAAHSAAERAALAGFGFVKDIVAGGNRRLQEGLFSAEILCDGLGGDIQSDGRCEVCEEEDGSACCLYDIGDINIDALISGTGGGGMSLECAYCDDYCGEIACGSYEGTFDFSSSTLSITGCTNVEAGAVCLDFDCITEEEDDDSVCSCQSATFNNQDCSYCEFDEDSGSTPTVDCSNVGGPTQAAFDMCLFEVEEEEQEENIDSVEEPPASAQDAPLATEDTVEEPPASAQDVPQDKEETVEAPPPLATEDSVEGPPASAQDVPQVTEETVEAPPASAQDAPLATEDTVEESPTSAQDAPLVIPEIPPECTPLIGGFMGCYMGGSSEEGSACANLDIVSLLELIPAGEVTCEEANSLLCQPGVLGGCCEGNISDIIRCVLPSFVSDDCVIGCGDLAPASDPVPDTTVAATTSAAWKGRSALATMSVVGLAWILILFLGLGRS